MASTILVDGILFDMDGTLIDSTPGVLNAWAKFSADYNLGDHLKVAHETHGRRLSDTLREYCGIKDEGALQAESDRFEGLVIEGGPVILPGVAELLNQLETVAPTKWTIVTSASSKYASLAIQGAGLPMPKVGIITSNDVTQGKPHPTPYLAGAQRIGLEPTKCIVIEDAISGLKAGSAAQAQTLAVCTTTPRAILCQSGANPNFVVNDLTRVSIRIVEDKLEVTIDETE